MNTRTFFVVLAMLVAFTGMANADLTGVADMKISATSLTNIFGSGNWPTSETNTITGLKTGQAQVGDPNTDPGAFKAVTSITPGQVIVSGFNSWNGQANPQAPFNNEYGNRLHFALAIASSKLFNLNGLSFDVNSNDAANTLGFSGDFVGLSYTSRRQGLYYGADGVLGGGDDVWYTSGEAGTYLINAIYYVGVGVAEDATFQPGATYQDKLDSITAYVTNNITQITGSYTLVDTDGRFLATASTTVDVVGAQTTVPEPSSVFLLLTLAGTLGFRARERFAR